jgi:hypothetical protein
VAQQPVEPPTPPPDDPMRRQQDWEEPAVREGDVSPAEAARLRKKALEQMKNKTEETSSEG